MGAVPENLRPAIREQLDALVRGARPELLTWVRSYGGRGATLVRQPDDIWDHSQTDADLLPDGSWQVLLPVWTEDESPSDLTLEVHVDSNGAAHMYDLHAL